MDYGIRLVLINLYLEEFMDGPRLYDRKCPLK